MSGDQKQTGIQGEYLQFGGMAVPEGVMMRSPHYYAVACRVPNGEIVVKTSPLQETWIGRQQWLKKPFLRGTLALLDTMALGTRAMNWASQTQLDPKYSAPGEEADGAGNGTATGSKTMDAMAVALAVIVSLGFGFVVFKAIPEFVAQISLGGADKVGIWTNLVAGLVKIILFIGYLAVIRRLPAIYEVFRYHGAEHKAINTIEAGLDLEPDAVLDQTRLHPRCGTNFAIIVLLIGFLTMLFIPRYPVLFGHQIQGLFEPVLLRIGWELLLLPIIAGTSYEIIRAAGKAKDARWVELLLKPGLATQLITTAEPGHGHAEVAIASLNAVILAEQSGELTNTEDPDDGKSVPVRGETAEDVIS